MTLKLHHSHPCSPPTLQRRSQRRIQQLQKVGAASLGRQHHRTQRRVVPAHLRGAVAADTGASI